LKRKGPSKNSREGEWRRKKEGKEIFAALDAGKRGKTKAKWPAKFADALVKKKSRKKKKVKCWGKKEKQRETAPEIAPEGGPARHRGAYGTSPECSDTKKPFLPTHREQGGGKGKASNKPTRCRRPLKEGPSAGKSGLV